MRFKRLLKFPGCHSYLNKGKAGNELLGCQTQSESGFHFVFFFFLVLLIFSFFSVSVKVLPVTPLLSGVFVHRVFCAYFVRFEGAGVMRRFVWCT